MEGKKYNTNCLSYAAESNAVSPTLRAIKIIIPLMIVTVIILVVFFCFMTYRSSENKPNTTDIDKQSVFYSDEEQKLLTLVVNSANPLDSNYVVHLTSYNGVQINTIVKDPLDQMISEAQKDGVKLSVLSGYVSFDEQTKKHKQLVEQYKNKNNFTQVKAEALANKTVPTGGCSEYQTGLLICFSENSEDFEKSDEYKWLEYNAVNYGFILRYDGNESGLLNKNTAVFRFVGKENAKKMRVLNMCLEEYSNYLSYR